MRIIGGELAGRIIPESKYFKSRPTTDIAKEGLFNMLNNDYYFDEIIVLDMFAGTGSISFEFASRGTEHIIALDNNSKNVSFIRNTAQTFGLISITIMQADSFKFAKDTTQKFDIIFADPPFDLENIEQIPVIVFENELLKPEGLLVLEHSGRLDFTKHEKFKKLKNYGKLHFSFFNA
jgi:16S rRNA (guanine(966)-N(2))-methyltransferase RsmD